MPYRVCVPCAVLGIEVPATGQRALWSYPDGHADLVWLCDRHVEEYDEGTRLYRQRLQAQRIAARMRREV